jgi:hypothetical protein
MLYEDKTAREIIREAAGQLADAAELAVNDGSIDSHSLPELKNIIEWLMSL